MNQVENNVESNNIMSDTSFNSAEYGSHSVKIHCRGCGIELFTGFDLRFWQGYYCLNTYFIENLIRIDWNTKLFYCSAASCESSLGHVAKFNKRFNKSFLYMINIKGIKFIKENGQLIIASKWKRASDLLKELIPISNQINAINLKKNEQLIT